MWPNKTRNGEQTSSIKSLIAMSLIKKKRIRKVSGNAVVLHERACARSPDRLLAILLVMDVMCPKGFDRF